MMGINLTKLVTTIAYGVYFNEFQIVEMTLESKVKIKLYLNMFLKGYPLEAKTAPKNLN